MRRTRPSHGTPGRQRCTPARRSLALRGDRAAPPGRRRRSSLSGLSAPRSQLRWRPAPGGVRERPNRHDWKSCVGKLTVGSNPTASATWAPTRPHARDRRRPASPTVGGPRSTDDAAMGLALDEAAAGGRPRRRPGRGGRRCVDGRVIAARHNERELRGDPTAHAEMLALRRRGRGARHLAAVRGHPGGDPRALPDVRRGPWWPPGWVGWSSGPPTRRPGRADPSTTCAPTPGSTTRCR